MGGGTVDDERNDNNRLRVFLIPFYLVLTKLFLKTYALHPDILDFDLLLYLFLWLVFTLVKEFFLFIFRILSSERGFKKGRRTFGIQRGPRQSKLFVSWDHCYIIQKLERKISNWRWTSSSKFPYVPHTKRIRMMMGSFSSEIRHSGGNGIFDPAGEISSSPFSYIYKYSSLFPLPRRRKERFCCCMRARWRQSTYLVSFQKPRRNTRAEGVAYIHIIIGWKSPTLPKLLFRLLLFHLFLLLLL